MDGDRVAYDLCGGTQCMFGQLQGCPGQNSFQGDARYSNRIGRHRLGAAGAGLRRVLALSGAIAAVVFAAAAEVALFDGASAWQSSYVLSVLLFVLMLAYQGVRLGRATHIVDMADASKRGAYTAISNTAVGILLISGGLFGFITEHAGLGIVFTVFAVMSIAALVLSLGLHEVQGSDSETENAT